MTSSHAQLQRLVAMHRDLIMPGAALWRKAEAERRFKKRHFFTLAAEQSHVAVMCLRRACDVTGVSETSILGRRRHKRWADARHIAMTVAYELSGLSTIALGKLFNRGHDMILHAQRRVNETPSLRVQADKVAAAVKRELKKK